LTKVKLRPNESQESLLRRFRKKVTRNRVMTEVRKRRWYMSPSEQRRLAKKKAIRRMKRRQRRNRDR
jgi:small subunit ribosomal protein S21